MRSEPKHRVIELLETKRFSLGAGTQIASVHIELGDIRERDLPEELRSLPLNEARRIFAEETASSIVLEKWQAEFGELDKNIPDNQPVSFLTVHQQDSVTVEIWKQGPERRTVKVI